MDWSLVKSFLVVAETGSLSAAARELSQSQPTLGRQIKELERQLGLELFDRRPRGLALTDAGARLLEPARAMRAAFHEVELQAGGMDAHVTGTVRVTASQVVAHHVLPTILAELRLKEPEIQIELVASDGSDNLLFREADIAVRMYRSTQLDVITKKVVDTRFAVFAAPSYLERFGRPERLEDLIHHRVVGYDRDDRILRGMRNMGWEVSRDWFAMRCDDQNVYWELVRAGCGIGFAQSQIGRRDREVECLFDPLPIPPLPIWLAAPEAMRHTPRIKRVWERLEEGLRTHFSEDTALA